jgi:hypothetical protein
MLQRVVWLRRLAIELDARQVEGILHAYHTAPELAPSRAIRRELIIRRAMAVELRDEAKELVGQGVLLVVTDIDVDDLITVEQTPHLRSLLEVVHELRIVQDAVEPR